MIDRRREAPGLDQLIDWILRQAAQGTSLGEILSEVCERLGARGIRLWRANIGTPTIDPSTRGTSVLWWREQPLTILTLDHGEASQAAFRQNPIYSLLSRSLTAARWRLDRGEGGAHPLLARLREAGGTDYLLQLVKFGPDTALIGAALSVASDCPGGFSAGEIRTFRRLVPALGLAAYSAAIARTATDTLGVYLGPGTGRRVLAGDIRRGEGKSVSAAIVLADLKHFTAMTEREDPLAVVGWLNEHFDALGEPIAAQGGEILKFMGDGLLAVFPVDGTEQHPCPACDRALAAAEDSIRRTQALNERRQADGQPRLEVDIALHFGDVVYGNVGTARRLDFTVIGRAVNEASRMETLCDDLGRNLVLSAEFARRCTRATTGLGLFTLRGMKGKRELHGL